MKRFLIRLINGKNTLFSNVSAQEESMLALDDSSSEQLAISGTSAASAAVTLGQVVVTPSVDCFFTQGTAPVAVSDGTDQILLAFNSYRITRIVDNNKLAFITGGASGNVFISPGA